jgi:hypothetical protein
MPSRDRGSREASFGAGRTLFLDPDTADRLLSGSMSCDDAPPEYRSVSLALATLRAASTESELVGESAAVASIAAVLAASGARALKRRRSRVSRALRHYATAIGSLMIAWVLFSGLAAANALPQAAQHVASEVLRTFGVRVPDPGRRPGPDGDTSGRSNEHAPLPASPPSTAPSGESLQPQAPQSPVAALDAPARPDDPVNSGAPPSTTPAAVPNHAHGRTQAAPGNSASVNGHVEPAPGNSGNANGHTEPAPENSRDANGRRP